MKNKKSNGVVRFFVKFFIGILVLVGLFFLTVRGTKYYFYDSDYAVKRTDLAIVSIDGIKIGMNASEVDTTKYELLDDVVEDCNYNFKELSFRTNDKGVIEYIVANYSKIDLDVGQEDNSKRIKKVNEVFDLLGRNYKEELYNATENNYWKIARYSDTENDIYMGLIYSRYNNELNKIILSNERLK